MLRKYLLQKYIELEGVEEILGHSSFIYLRWVVSYTFLLFLVYVGYSVWHQANSAEFIKWIAGVLWLVLFFCWLFSFLNLYLDCLLFTKGSIIVFLRDGLLQYRTEIFDWSRISVVSYRQDSFLDKLCNKGDILIQLWGIDFTFTDVHSPKKSVARILFLKKRYEEEQGLKIEHDLANDNNRFEVLVNTLWGILQEYMDKNGHSGQDDGF